MKYTLSIYTIEKLLSYTFKKASKVYSSSMIFSFVWMCVCHTHTHTHFENMSRVFFSFPHKKGGIHSPSPLSGLTLWLILMKSMQMNFKPMLQEPLNLSPALAFLTIWKQQPTYEETRLGSSGMRDCVETKVLLDHQHWSSEMEVRPRLSFHVWISCWWLQSFKWP